MVRGGVVCVENDVEPQLSEKRGLRVRREALHVRATRAGESSPVAHLS